MMRKDRDDFIELGFSLPMTTKEIKHVVSMVQQAACLFNAKKEVLCDKIPLIIDEALRNCIDHGNSRDPQKRIQLSVILNNKVIVFSFKDEGEGFDFRSALRELNIKSHIGLDPNRGRGMLLLSKLADRLDYHSKGRELRVILKIDGLCGSFNPS